MGMFHCVAGVTGRAVLCRHVILVRISLILYFQLSFEITEDGNEGVSLVSVFNFDWYSGV